MTKKIKAKDLNPELVAEWMTKFYPEAIATSFITLMGVVGDKQISTENLSDDDDNADADDASEIENAFNKDEGKKGKGKGGKKSEPEAEAEGEEVEALPWDALDGETLKELAGKLELEESKPKEIRPVLNQLWGTKKGKKSIIEKIKEMAEGEDGGEEGDAGVDLGFNIDLDKVTKAALKTAKGEWADSDDAAGVTHLTDYYVLPGGITKKKPAGALDIAIKADALYADIDGKVSDEDLDAAAKTIGFKVAKGLRGDDKKAAIVSAVVSYAISQLDA